MTSSFQRQPLVLPGNHRRILLHSCCAPCSSEIIEALHASDLDVTVFFYNPNIYPIQEYERRKMENLRFAQKLGIPFVDADYDCETWFAHIQGLELEPERGSRCSKCFNLRLERTALYACEHGFPVFATSLGISRWKNLGQVNQCGIQAASRHHGLIYWDRDWRKGGGADRLVEIRKREGFYQQAYCGCPYSCHGEGKECQRSAGE
ncbi:MAG TPA: epoxyqueuosine reductase QueH [Holophaga sp.]|nr:epoxyqueuosine reductase QueH [Holophaga sp.]